MGADDLIHIPVAAAALEANKKQINELNVFPVPDGDTGTNMSMTMGAAAAELRKKPAGGVGDVAKITANALLRGARGNSGVILSLLFRGLSKTLKGKDTFDAHDFAAAMGEGVEAAYNAVMKPAEGTILTVSRLSASAAADFAESGSDVELMFSCAIEAAKEALADTMRINPVLKKAGVVDAQLPEWNRRVGWETLLNTRGMMWRRLSDAERADVNEAKALALMVEYPTLIKRPVVDTGAQLIVGFDPENYESLFA